MSAWARWRHSWKPIHLLRTSVCMGTHIRWIRCSFNKLRKFKFQRILLILVVAVVYSGSDGADSERPGKTGDRSRQDIFRLQQALWRQWHHSGELVISTHKYYLSKYKVCIYSGCSEDTGHTWDQVKPGKVWNSKNDVTCSRGKICQTMSKVSTL